MVEYKQSKHHSQNSLAQPSSTLLKTQKISLAYIFSSSFLFFVPIHALDRQCKAAF